MAEVKVKLRSKRETDILDKGEVGLSLPSQTKLVELKRRITNTFRASREIVNIVEDGVLANFCEAVADVFSATKELCQYSRELTEMSSHIPIDPHLDNTTEYLELLEDSIDEEISKLYHACNDFSQILRTESLIKLERTSPSKEFSKIHEQSVARMVRLFQVHFYREMKEGGMFARPDIVIPHPR